MIVRNPDRLTPAQMFRLQQQLSDGQVALWSQFVLAYESTTTRDMADRFLRALTGAPRG